MSASTKLLSYSLFSVSFIADKDENEFKSVRSQLWRFRVQWVKKLPGGRRSLGEGTVPPHPETPWQPRSWPCRGRRGAAWGSVGMVLGATAAGCCGGPALPGGTCAGASGDAGRDNVCAEPGLLSKATNLQRGSCAYCVTQFS